MENAGIQFNTHTLSKEFVEEQFKNYCQRHPDEDETTKRKNFQKLLDGIFKRQFAVHKNRDFHASIQKLLENRYGEVRIRSIEEVPVEEGTILYGERWHIAKCYCRDCENWNPNTKKCWSLGRYTRDNWFCWDALPRKIDPDHKENNQ